MKAIEGASRERHERRICAGDWVRLTGSGPSVRGIGKVVEGDYDAADGSLRCARVEFARGSVWFFPGDLRRIGEDEEKRLVQDALAHARMPESAAERLRSALLDPERVGRRSPGLLDMLWSLMGSLPNERAVNGLARFFDEGGAPATKVAPQTAESQRPSVGLIGGAGVSPARAGETPAPPTHHLAIGAFAPSGSWGTVQPPALPAPPREAPVAGTILERVLAVFNHGVLRQLADRWKVQHEPREPVITLREKLVASGMPLGAVLANVTDNQLRQVARTLLVPSDGEPAVVRSLVLALAAMQGPVPSEAAGPAPTEAEGPSPSVAERPAPPRPPLARTPGEVEVDVIGRVLDALDLLALRGVARDLGVSLRPRESVGAHRNRIEAAAPHLGAVISPLNDDELRAVALSLGVESSGSRAEVAGRILALASGAPF